MESLGDILKRITRRDTLRSTNGGGGTYPGSPQTVEACPICDGEGLPIGSNVFLIGYPAEAQQFPQPTITSGILSRVRQWDGIEMTYLQTDAAIAGGQSGGVLASDKGEVIGISGLSLSEARFGVVASAVDVLGRIRRLSAGQDVAGLGDRPFTFAGGRLEHTFMLEHRVDNRMYVLGGPINEPIRITVESENDGGFIVVDPYGNVHLEVDENLSGRESGSFNLSYNFPLFLHVWQNSRNPGEFRLSSNINLVPYSDPDDGNAIKVGQTLRGSLDAPFDTDYFIISLSKGDTVEVSVQTANFDPAVGMGFLEAADAQWVGDDDSGRGLFGVDAELIYRAPHTGSYFINVFDALGVHHGGYVFSVVAAPPGSVPIPIPAGPKQIDSPFGPMTLYESAQFPFSIQYPADWSEQPTPENTTATFAGDNNAQLLITEEDLVAAGLGKLTLIEYVDLVISVVESNPADPQLVSRQRVSTAHGSPAEILLFDTFGGLFKGSRFIFLHDNKIAFNASYVAPKDRYAELQPLFEYSFGTFNVGQ